MYNECRHIMPSGSRCHSPALRDKPYCYYHNKLHRLGDASSHSGQELSAPAIEDASGIQIALTQVLSALNSPHMDTRRAGLMLYGLQIAAQLTRPGQVAAKSIQDITSDADGKELAPERIVCEPGIDCANCRHQDECSNYEDPDDEDDFNGFEPYEDDDDE